MCSEIKNLLNVSKFPHNQLATCRIIYTNHKLPFSLCACVCSLVGASGVHLELNYELL